MTKIQHGAILECKWEVFKKVSLVQTNIFRPTIHLGNALRNLGKNGLIKNVVKLESVLWFWM